MASVALPSWSEILALRAWTPLEQVSEAPIELGRRLFKIGVGMYVVALPHFSDMTPTPGHLWVTMAVWAESDGAARRAELMEVEADELGDLDPPAELLVGGSREYGALVGGARASRLDPIETGVYRVGSDGAFVHRKLSAANAAWLFRSRRHEDHDVCYAIETRLRD